MQISNERSVAPRHNTNIFVKASIIGHTVDQEFKCINLSLTGMALISESQQCSFQIGTIIEMKLPVKERGSKKSATLELMGRVVRVEKKELEKSSQKNLCGVQLINMDTEDNCIWADVVQSLG